jgi:hypothetical protein
MIENVLRHWGGVAVYGVLAICLFFAFFLGVLLWAGRLKQPYLDAMGELPLQEDDSTELPSDTKPPSPQRHE